VNENNDSLLNNSIKLPSSASSAEDRKKRGRIEGPVEMLERKNNASSAAKNRIEELKSAVQLPPKVSLVL
jgi:hypothetical protein